MNQGLNPSGRKAQVPKRIDCFTAICLFLSSVFYVSAQSSKPLERGLIRMSHEEREELRRLNHRVILNVVVTDPSGKTVSGLTEKDFTLLDQEKPQTLKGFQMVEGKSLTGRAHIVLVIDSVNNGFAEIARQRHAVDTYLRRNQGQLSYPIALAFLSDTGIRLTDSSTDGSLLANKLHDALPGSGRFRFNGGPSGGSQRFLLSIQALGTLAQEESNVAGRAIVVWLGQGWPSLIDPGYVLATPADKKSYFDALVQLSTTLRIAQITIDRVTSSDPGHLASDLDATRPRGIRKPEDAEAQDLSLATIAELTGGRALRQQKDLISGIDQCVADAETYYRLSFDPDITGLPDQPRFLSIRLDKPSLLPRTYSLYYTQP